MDAFDASNASQIWVAGSMSGIFDLDSTLSISPHRASKTSLFRVAVRIKNANASLADKLLSVARMAWINADTLS